jgi:hypothetical protein
MAVFLHMARAKRIIFRGTSASDKALFGAQKEDIGLENAYSWGVNNE